MGPDESCLVTGGHGFVGRHLVGELERAGYEVIAPAHAELDLLDAGAVRGRLADARPGRVFHLAALASVARSWEDPAETLRVNEEMTLNVLAGVRAEAPDAAVLLASSGTVYGPPASLPLTEEAPLRPRSPYAVSKVACELLGELYRHVHGLHVVRARAFNHAGPGQADHYVVGTLTRQLAEAELAGEPSVTIRTGDPASARDFCDVRDVVRAYRMAVDAAPETYNVASGRAVTVAALVDTLAQTTAIEVVHEVDPERVRRHDTREAYGSAARLEEATGWRPEIPLGQTLADAVAAWRAELAEG